MEVRREGKEDKRRGQIAGGNSGGGRVAPENSLRIKAYYWLLPASRPPLDGAGWKA